MLIYRLPAGTGFLAGRSRCATCQHNLGIQDLLPIVSYFFLRGKCRYCKTSISYRYPLVEASCGILFVIASLFFPLFSLIPVSFVLFLLLVMSVIDCDTQQINDGLVITIGITGVVWVLASLLLPDVFPYAPDWQNALIGAFVGGVPLILIDKICLIILKKDGFGYGDVKLMTAVGIFLGWQLTILALILAFVSGGVIAAILMFSGRATRGTYIAFGPFLALGAVMALFSGFLF